MTWRPLPRRPDPRVLGESLDRVTRSLGGPGASVLSTVFSRWAEVVGAPVAAHSWPVSLVRKTLTVGVDDPAWAAQLSWLEADLLRRLDEMVGPGAVLRVKLSVRPERPANW